MAIKMDSPIYWQKSCILRAKKRGFHLINQELEATLNTLPYIEIGLMNLFLQHTSASICISENASPEVASDLETYFNKTIPDNLALYQHTIEGEDDMPAHIKNVILGASLTIPITKGKLALGQWQGIYLCEHRNEASSRKLILTAQGYG